MRTRIKNLFSFAKRAYKMGLFWTLRNNRVRRTRIENPVRAKEEEGVLDVTSLTETEIIRELKERSDLKLKIHSIHLEFTLVCNLRCPGCLLTHNTSTGVWQAQHMKFPDFEKIAEHLPRARVIALHNYGEPSLNPKFKEMVERLASSGKFEKIALTTNLLTRDVEDFEELLRTGISHITVSIDTFDPELVNELRTRTKVEKLKNNIDRIIQNFGHRLTIATVASQKNLHDLPKTFNVLNEMCRKHGQEVVVSLIKFDDNELENLTEKKLVKRNYIDLNALSLEWKKKFKYLTINLPAEVSEPSRICMRPLKNPKISVDGTVMVCGRHLEPAVADGACNLKERSYEDIFRDTRMIDYLTGFIEAAPSYCPGCESHLPRSEALAAGSRV